MVKKLTTEEINAVKVEGKSSFLNNGVKENQKVFDALPLKVNEKLNAVIDAVNTNETGISGHNGNKSNPHSVTKAQVGLGNVDNTSDKDKPVSVATSAALAEKADKTELAQKVDRAELAVALTEKADVSALEKKADALTENGGFAGGLRARSDSWGAAIGADAHAFYGGLAGGIKSQTYSGLAGGAEACSRNGFAGGKNAVAGAGVAAGEGAKTIDKNDKPIDAIQLGTGINPNSKTLQVYEHQLFDANTGKLVEGVIPDSVAKADELEAFEKEVAETIAELETEVESKRESSYPKIVAQRWDSILFACGIRFESENLPKTLPKGTRLQFLGTDYEGEEIDYDGVLTVEAQGLAKSDGHIYYELSSADGVTPVYMGCNVIGDTVTVTLPCYWEYTYDRETIDEKLEDDSLFIVKGSANLLDFGSTLTTDKSYSEIVEAHDAGKKVVLIYQFNAYELVSAFPDYQTVPLVKFVCVGGTDNTISITYIELTPDSPNYAEVKYTVIDKDEYYTKAEVNNKLAESGSGGNNDFVINVTGIVDETHVTLDKTFAEMQTAYSEGKDLYMVGTLDGTNYSIARLAVISGSYVVFTALVNDERYSFDVLNNGNGNIATIYHTKFVVEGQLGDYYNCPQIDQKLEMKADKADLNGFVTEEQLDEALLGMSGGEVNLDNYYTKDEINSSLSGKADKSEVEAEVSGLEVALDTKADKATTLSGYGITDAYDKMLINSLLNAKANKAAVEADITALSAGMMLKADNSDLNNFYPIDVINDMLAGKADVSEVNALSNIVTELGDVAEEDVVPVSKGGTGATTAAEALTALGGVRISAKQTYSGGGFCDNWLHLEFGFSPKLMFICGGGCSAVFVRDTDEAVVCGAEGDSDGSAHYCTLVWGNDNSIWWRGDTIKSQFNLSGVIYTAYAIG